MVATRQMVTGAVSHDQNSDVKCPLDSHYWRDDQYPDEWHRGTDVVNTMVTLHCWELSKKVTTAKTEGGRVVLQPLVLLC